MTARKSFFISCISIIITSGVFGQNRNTTLPVKTCAEMKSRYDFPQDVPASRPYRIHHVILDLNVRIADSLLEGAVTLGFTAEDTLTRTEFDAGERLEVMSVRFRGSDRDFKREDDLLIVNLGTALTKGESDSVTIHYKARAQRDMFSPLVLDEHETGPVLWTLSQPYGAKQWWPGNHVLWDKIDSLDVFITAPDTLTAVSNGIKTSEKHTGDRLTVHWKHRHPIVSYLVAAAVSNYTITEQQLKSGSGTVHIQNFVFPQDINRFRDELTTGAETFFWFDTLLTPYPYMDEKYGNAQMLRWGGMEHTTVTFAHHFGLELYTHELAHHWFGNHITCSSWHDIWLNEGFATFFQGLVYESFPSAADPQALIEWKRLRKKAITSLNDGSVYVDDTTSADRIFNSRLTYQKAGFVLFMLRDLLGHDAFFEALNQYLLNPDLAEGFARTQDLIDVFESETGRDLTDFFDRWIFNQGHPVYRVDWSRENGEVRVNFDQKPSHSSVSFFPDSFDIALWSNGTAHIERVALSQNAETFTFQTGSSVDSISFDPHHRTLAEFQVYSTGELGEIALYPNPARNEINIELKEFDGRILEVRVFDMLGRSAVERKNLETNVVRIETGDLPRGTYQADIKTADRRVVKKFILK